MKKELATSGPHLPIYFGNRNWHPLLADTLRHNAGRRDSKRAGIRDIGLQLLLELSPVSGKHRGSASRSRPEGAPQIDKLRVFFNHPGFPRGNRGSAQRCARRRFPPLTHRTTCKIVFYVAHSIPMSMAQHLRLREAIRGSLRRLASQAPGQHQQPRSRIPKPQRRSRNSLGSSRISSIICVK